MNFDPYIEPVAELCRKYHVHRLYLYGSILTDKLGPKSDIDFYVEFQGRFKDNRHYKLRYISGLRCDLRKLFGRVIDLKIEWPQCTRSNERVLIYGGECTVAGKVESTSSEMTLNEETPLVTIALPVWNSQMIAWVSMESFCRQEGAVPFELIVFEEQHAAQCGHEYFFTFGERLKEAGCTRILYMSCERKFSLAEKWCYIAREATSEAFCLCGCDDYYSKHMVRDAYAGIKEGCDYIYDTSAYFYSTTMRMMIVYDEVKEKGIMQCVPTAKMKRVRPEVKNSGVDSWIVGRIKPRNKRINTQIRDIVCTDGFNNISNREPYYRKIARPFFSTSLTIFDVLPHDIAERLHAI